MLRPTNIISCKQVRLRRNLATLATIQEPTTFNTFNPSIRHDPFNSIIKPLEIPLNTKPHPLIQMNLETISKLTKKELNHLNQINYGDINEKAELCFKLSNIFQELSSTKQASWIYNSINDEEIKQVISTSISQRSCALNFIIDSTSHITHSEFTKLIITIANDGKPDKSDRLLNLFSSIANTEMVNTKLIQINTSVFQNILNIIDGKDYPLLYSYMIQINFRPKSSKKFQEFKQRLLNDSIRSKFIAHTGYINPKWLDLNKTEFGQTHTLRLIESFAMEELEISTEYFILQNEPAKSSLFLNFMLMKLEKISSTKNKLYIDQQIQRILNTVIKLVIKFKDASSGIQILNHMVSENLKIDFQIYLTFLRHLRSINQYDEFISILNDMNLQDLKPNDKKLLASEILLLMKQKFPSSSKVIIGYIGALFDNGLETLNDLGILSLPYESTIANKISTVDIVQIANIDQNLKGSKINSEHLAPVYDVLLNSLHENNDASTIMKYYEKFVLADSELHTNDRTVTVFLNHLLYNGDEKHSTQIPINYQYAKHIFEYYKQFKIRNISMQSFELLIEVALKQFNDVEFASKVMAYTRTCNKQFTSNQIISFIEKFTKDGDETKVELWLNQLKLIGIERTNSRKIVNSLDSKDAYLYKWSLTKKKRNDKLALVKLNKDNLMFETTNNSLDEITEEIIND
ncbi:hypothetical protein KGF54_003637 [Candida jiufengensis]|uniref:uncharacterized protein n=1 Tax=Candida jiufengensis TaxID=497108 RepID=UPI0022253198|nr:uncharacterized protein KGF54_003637 [Candida jiufengensis]KAI5952770.1 hypothetical protein KGF54_003637 [Candida jiufengensis]